MIIAARVPILPTPVEERKASFWELEEFENVRLEWLFWRKSAQSYLARLRSAEMGDGSFGTP